MKLGRFAAACLLVAASTLVALDWTETGSIPGASDITDLVAGPDSCLYAAGNSADTGYVCRSSDGYTWERCGVMPGYVRRVYALTFGRGETLFAGTRATFNGADSGHLYSSPDLGVTWQHRSSIADLAVGVVRRRARLVQSARHGCRAMMEVPCSPSSASWETAPDAATTTCGAPAARAVSSCACWACSATAAWPAASSSSPRRRGPRKASVPTRSEARGLSHGNVVASCR